MSQVSRRPEVGNHERRTPNTRLSSGTSAGTFAVSAGPYINYCAETGTKNELGMFFEPVQKRLEGLPAIRDVGCAHPGFASYLASIRCPKVRSVHPSKWPFWLRASKHKKTPACIRFQVNLDPNFGFYCRILQQRMALTADTVRVQVA